MLIFRTLKKGANGIMVITVGSELGYPSSILNEAPCISLNANTLGKRMNPNILLSAMDK